MTSDIDELFQDLDNFVNPKLKEKKTVTIDIPVRKDQVVGIVKSEKKRKKKFKKKRKNVVDTDLDDLDGFLNSINTPLTPVKKEDNQSASPVSPTLSPVKKRCSNPCVGRKNDKSRCLSLRCIRCNFAIKSFDNYVWNENVDYMFFRLNFPEKVHRRLKKRRGTTSYACQCSWVSVSEETTIFDLPNISDKWLCAPKDKCPSAIQSIFSQK